MTKEEAIKYLIPPVSTSTVMGEETAKQFEAYRMAVEALRQETNGSCSLDNSTASL